MERQGQCLCGSIQFTVNATRDDLSRCHCKQCRQWGGGFDSLVVDLDQLAINAGGDALSWYQSSALVHRGFCNKCGSSLFWKYQDANAATPTIDVSAGTLEDTSGLTVTRHIFCASKGGYYEIDDQVQQFETS